MSNFYYDFENKFRGSRDLITKRLEIYDPFFQFVIDNFEHPKSLDIACGRGELVEYLQNKGFIAKGVDLNKQFINDCLSNHLDVTSEDAFEYLKKIPSNSISLISSLHFIEHVTFEYLYKLIIEIFRVLAPGGLLILETPNPENIGVSTNSFYFDPTHLKPIPYEFLNFVLQHIGFVNSIQIANEDQAYNEPMNVKMINIIRSVPPDYGIVSQKNFISKDIKINSLITRFMKITKKNKGVINLDYLSEQYEKKLEYYFKLSSNQGRMIHELEKKIEDQSRRIEDQSRRIEDQSRRIEDQSMRIEDQEKFFLYSWFKKIKNKIRGI